MLAPCGLTGFVRTGPAIRTIKGVSMKYSIQAKLPSVALIFLATWLLLILPNMG
jgi:hypothetical protein